MTDPATPAPSPEPMAPLSSEERARAAGLAMLSLHAGDVAALSVERDRLASEVETLRSQLAAAMANAAETMHAARMVEAEAIRERDEARARADSLDLTNTLLHGHRADALARLEKARECLDTLALGLATTPHSPTCQRPCSCGLYRALEHAAALRSALTGKGS